MKFIFVAGGVLSGVGKGVASASIGKILQEYGFSVTMIKVDPYINFDAGTMRPTEHGEVWVTDDGGEIDQDLGNYERFLNIDVSKNNNITTGQVYGEIIRKERAGEYLGQTVQFMPHIPEEITRRIKESASGFDFCIIEIGGTVGDYENVPFLLAAKRMEIELGKENVIHVLVSYLPVPSHVGEAKTKPTQQAIRMLNQNAITPDLILCRSVNPIDDVRRKKLQACTHLDPEYIVSAPDIKNTIYSIPLNFEKEKLGMKLLTRFNLTPKKQPDWSEWKRLVDSIENPQKTINIAMVGKYVEIGDYQLADSYISINESLKHAGAHLNASVKISWIDAKEYEKDVTKLLELNKYDGIIVPGGFGNSGVEGKILAIKHARENNIPFLGLCYGLQLAIIEYARNICSMDGAHTTEVNPDTSYPVIDILPDQRELMKKSQYGGTMRLGAYAAKLKDGSVVLNLYEKSSRISQDSEQLSKVDKKRIGKMDIESGNIILERHRHRFEVNPEFIQKISDKGLVFSGTHTREDGTELMEFIELPEHKFFVATQAHPEFKSRLIKPAPLFLGFIEACCKK